MKLEDVFSDYFTVRTQMVDAVKDLTAGQLAWQPPHHPNSIGYLLVHIAETEAWWISVVALGKPEPPESTFEGVKPREEILRLLDHYHREFTGYLRNEPLEDWNEVMYRVPGREGSISKRDLVWHVVEHQARHRGQIFMLLRMQGLEVPHV